MHGTGKLYNYMQDRQSTAGSNKLKPTLCPSGVHHDASFERFSNPWHTRTPGPQQGPAAHTQLQRSVFQTACPVSLCKNVTPLLARFSVGMLQACYDY